MMIFRGLSPSRHQTSVRIESPIDGEAVSSTAAGRLPCILSEKIDVRITINRTNIGQPVFCPSDGAPEFAINNLNAYDDLSK
jgi:hypothetical protein